MVHSSTTRVETGGRGSWRPAATVSKSLASRGRAAIDDSHGCLYYSNIHARSHPRPGGTATDEAMGRVATIPTYELYGRPRGWPTPEPLYCESLAKANAAHAQDSLIRSHRHPNLHQLFCFTGGEVAIELEGTWQEVTAPAALLVAPLTVHGFVFKADNTGYILTFPSFAPRDFLGLTETEVERLAGTALITDRDSSDFTILEGGFARLLEEFNGRCPGRIHALRAHTLAVVLWVYRALAVAAPCAAVDTDDRVLALVNRFRSLVDRHFHEQWPLSRYARELGISTTHLNRLTRQCAQEKASEVIRDRVLLEARRDLTYTVKSVSEIAYSLGYRDPAYFSRVFTRATGMSPTTFRRHAAGD